MTSQTVELPLSELRELVTAALTALGLTANERQIVADVLLWAELRGNSQGLSKIPARAVAPDPEAGEIIVTRRSPVVTQIEGNLNLGMVVMDRAVDEALRSAAGNGIGVVGTRGTATSTGAIGYFAERAAKLGYLCMIFGGTPKAVAPFGSVDAIFGTNPLSFAVPTNDGPLLFDMGTSAVTWFGLIQSERLGESIPDDLAFDAAGNATTDPGAALRGAIRAFGGPKGSGLALLIEILTGPLAGGAIVGDAAHQSGNVILTLDPDLFGFGAEFSARTAALIDRIRNSRPVEGRDRPQIPGERSRDACKATTRQDRVNLDKELFAAIKAIADA
ncbi:MAG: Ldh family oxidoreductase [Gammaproteobacteria bacterium]|nr:Ldh family oxidoreductase [Gammaproteobacteria bacterium]